MLFSFQKKTGNHFKQLCIKWRQMPGCRNTAYDTGAGVHVICRVSLPCHQCGRCNHFWDPSRVYTERVTQPADLPVACFLKHQDSCKKRQGTSALWWIWGAFQNWVQEAHPAVGAGGGERAVRTLSSAGSPASPGLFTASVQDVSTRPIHPLQATFYSL